MVGHVRGFLDMVCAALTDVVEALRKSKLWAGLEVHIQDSSYDRIDSIDFSREVLSVQTRRLIALQMGPTGWSDLGRPECLVEVLEQAGLDPKWMKEWQVSRQPPALAAQLVNSAVS